MSLGADVLVPVYSYLSLTEESEYTTTDEQYAETLETEQKLKRGTPEFEAADAMNFRERMKNIGRSAFIRRCPIGRSFAFTT